MSLYSRPMASQWPLSSAALVLPPELATNVGQIEILSQGAGKNAQDGPITAGRLALAQPTPRPGAEFWSRPGTRPKLELALATAPAQGRQGGAVHPDPIPPWAWAAARPALKGRKSRSRTSASLRMTFKVSARCDMGRCPKTSPETRNLAPYAARRVFGFPQHEDLAVHTRVEHLAKAVGRKSGHEIDELLADVDAFDGDAVFAGPFGHALGRAEKRADKMQAEHSVPGPLHQLGGEDAVQTTGKKRQGVIRVHAPGS